LAIVFSIMILHTGMSSAKSMTLKVSHQFAAGDVRDQMGRVFGRHGHRKNQWGNQIPPLPCPISN
jgi:hypothetical protein